MTGRRALDFVGKAFGPFVAVEKRALHKAAESGLGGLCFRRQLGLLGFERADFGRKAIDQRPKATLVQNEALDFLYEGFDFGLKRFGFRDQRREAGQIESGQLFRGHALEAGGIAKRAGVVHGERHGGGCGHSGDLDEHGFPAFKGFDFFGKRLAALDEALALAAADFRAEHHIFLGTTPLLIAVALRGPSVLHDAAPRAFECGRVTHDECAAIAGFQITRRLGITADGDKMNNGTGLHTRPVIDRKRKLWN